MSMDHPGQDQHVSEEAQATQLRSQDLLIDTQWIKDWVTRLDRGARYDAITELRLEKEKEVVNLNRELGERFREFARAVLEVYALMEAGVAPEELEQSFQRAKEMEQELREREEALDHTRKQFEAFEHMERQVSRMS